MLPGDYELGVMGSHKDLSLTAGEAKSIPVGYLRLKGSKKINQSRIIQKWGHPLTAYLNKQHIVFFGETVPVFPGSYTLNFSRSTEKKFFRVKEGETTYLNFYTLNVDSGCEKENTSCIKKIEVLLYSKGTKIPFMRGHSELWLPYFSGEIELEFKRSRGFRNKVGDTNRKQKIKMASLNLKPLHIYDASKETEFVRLEPISKNTIGVSQDLPYDRNTQMNLVSGYYRLVSYLKPKVEGGERKKIQQRIRLSPYQKKTKTFPFYLSKRQYNRLKSQNKLR